MGKGLENLVRNGMNLVGSLVVGATALLGTAEDSNAEYKLVQKLSPFNDKRPIRPETEFIVLHKTETNNHSTVDFIQKHGLANFVVDRAGTVYQTIASDRLAKHAGRSMWNGKPNTDNYSLGIEVVGMHDEDITEPQYVALKELLEDLQGNYNIPDKNVVSHSMIAYGAPNKYQHENHRGRKRCGMLFQLDEVRNKLGLTDKQKTDPDVNAGRLTIADSYLFKVLYGKPIVSYAKTETVKVEKQTPRSTPRPLEKTIEIPKIDVAKKTEDSLVRNYNSEGFEGFREIGKDGNTAWSIARNDYASKDTIYFLPNGYVRRGDELNKTTLNSIPVGTKVLTGYIYGGHVSADRSAWSICKGRWNFPDTFYRLPSGEVMSGDQIDQGAIKPGTLVLFRR